MEKAEISLSGRKILLISPRFFGYEEKITEHLRAQGAEVVHVDERPGTSFFIKALARLHTPLIRPIARRYFREQMARFGSTVFDDILVISPESFGPGEIRMVRDLQPGARLILYMWDSLANKGWRGNRAVDYVAHYDRSFSFDDHDSDVYGMTLRPLFYAGTAPTQPAEDPGFAFTFVGTIHSDRYRVLKSLRRCAEERDLEFLIYPYLPSQAHFWLFWLFKPEFWGTPKSAFQFAPMPYDQVLSVFQASQCIVDIEHPGQRGLTMRTLEVLGAGKHLITTNPNIRNYAFYRPDRVTVIDRRRVELPDPLPVPAPMPEMEKRSLSLAGWCEEIFSIGGCPANREPSR